MAQPPDPQLHIFGVRHHGPGSARSLRQALEVLQPDCVLVEGPPDAEGVLPLLAHPEMQPPVALLIYRPDLPRLAAYYPFAVFSPEWQAIRYGLRQGIPVRFMDLPQAYHLAQVLPDEADPSKETEGEPDETQPQEEQAEDEATESEGDLPSPREDPLRWLAEAAGYSDGERWWEHMVEQRASSTDLFAAILEAMTALREAAPMLKEKGEAEREARREAYMRQTIRTAQREGFTKIAVVCGAWHAPVLATMPPPEGDAALLKDLPKVKVRATWIPWTYGRLAYRSGYGAGVESPGWYHHLWTTPDHTSVTWMARVARLLRAEGLDASSAHIIEAVRTATSLAALRERPAVTLNELNEATRAVLCFGSDVPLHLIHEKLIVGVTLGSVPSDTPMVPLQVDLQREQKRLRLPAEASSRMLDLDLRNPNDLDRSYLLHRLALLGVPWGQTERTWGKKGTFHEVWTLEWQPEFVVSLVEAGIWGNTIEDAATAWVRDTAGQSSELPALTRLVDNALLANLSGAIPGLMSRLQEVAALSSDVAHMMEALPPLANVLRYSSVRRTDAGMVSHVVDGLVARICVGLPGAVASLNDEAAAAMFGHIQATHAAIEVLQSEVYTQEWLGALRQLSDQRGLHGLVAGRATRILLDAGDFSAEETARRMGLALSVAGDPSQAAAWVEGFLRGSGLVLVHDTVLLGVVDGWLAGLHPDTFTTLVPLLRRTFSTFTAPERRQIGEWARHGPAKAPPQPAAGAEAAFDTERAEAVLPLIKRLLGLDA